jgi:hypothetical protein
MMTREQHGLVSTNTYPYQPHFISRYPYFLFLDANHQSTLNPRTPTTLPVMYADEYGKTPLRHLIRINQSNPPIQASITVSASGVDTSTVPQQVPTSTSKADTPCKQPETTPLL